MNKDKYLDLLQQVINFENLVKHSKTKDDMELIAKNHAELMGKIILANNNMALPDHIILNLSCTTSDIHWKWLEKYCTDKKDYDKYNEIFQSYKRVRLVD